MYLIDDEQTDQRNASLTLEKWFLVSLFNITNLLISQCLKKKVPNLIGRDFHRATIASSTVMSSGFPPEKKNIKIDFEETGYDLFTQKIYWYLIFGMLEL